MRFFAAAELVELIARRRGRVWNERDRLRAPRPQWLNDTRFIRFISANERRLAVSNRRVYA
jgi:hypothetical protein